MVQSKGWNWAAVEEDIWSKPSDDIYYYLDRWKMQGFRRFLDLGCGLGRHALLFAENGFETDALDLSQYGIDILTKEAQNCGLNINTAVGDIHDLPYGPGSFDCLLAYHVLSHTDTNGIAKIIAEIRRVMKPGGEFFITLCSKSSPSYASGRYPRIDENTIVKTEEPEAGVSHFYVNLDDVRCLLSDFELFRIRQIQDIFDNNSSWHYFIHGRKIH